MQEEVEMRSVTLSVNAAKLTGRLLKAAIRKVLNDISKMKQKHKQAPIRHGKRTVKELTQMDAGASSMEATNLRVHSFDRVARKYGVDYAIYKDKSSGEKNKYLIFFKGRDADAITAAFKEYASKDIKRETHRASVLDKLHNLIERSRNIPATPVKNKDKGLEL